jgi:hypothetical protein
MKIRNIMENIGRHQPKKKYCNNKLFNYYWTIIAVLMNDQSEFC